MPAYLKEYRVRAGVTLRQAAEYVGVQPPAVHKWERKVTSPTLRDIERIAELYGIDPESFFIDPHAVMQGGDSIQRLTLEAAVADVLPSALLFVGRDLTRIDEAKEVTHLLKLWNRLSESLRKYWLDVGENYSNDEQHE